MILETMVMTAGVPNVGVCHVDRHNSILSHRNVYTPSKSVSPTSVIFQ